MNRGRNATTIQPIDAAAVELWKGVGKRSRRPARSTRSRQIFELFSSGRLISVRFHVHGATFVVILRNINLAMAPLPSGQVRLGNTCTFSCTLSHNAPLSLLVSPDYGYTQSTSNPLAATVCGFASRLGLYAGLDYGRRCLPWLSGAEGGSGEKPDHS